jgi:hypothetical protein
VKYFHAVNNQTAEEFVVGADKAAQVPLAVAGSTLSITLADTKDLFAFFRSGGTLHPKSRVDGPERFYLIKRDDTEPVLIRAKNEGEAVSIVGAVDLTVTPVKPATLVELLSRNVRQINCDADDDKATSEPSPLIDTGGAATHGENTPTPEATEEHSGPADLIEA